MQERIAIIDLGTNTFHLLVAEKKSLETDILHREKQPVKIGMGGINQGLITESGILRALTCLRDFKKIMDGWKVGHVFAFGTSALRSASNGKEVIEKIKLETGISVKLLSGDEEAEYIYYGIQSAMDLGTEKSLIVDIGGGSVEFIIGNSETVFWKQSFDIGAQRLLEQFQKHDPILTQEVIELEACFEKSLEPLRKAFESHPASILVGSSGTFDTLSEIYCIRNGLKLEPNQKETPLTSEAFHSIHMEFIECNRAERLRIPGMIEMRVDMIVVASCLVNFLLKKFTFKNIRVSSYSLKEGVLAKLKNNNPSATKVWTSKGFR